MPESPTQLDEGRYLYYHHCMPCHGDRGQGLTDEWREVWVEDHQNCWGRGCHTGRELAAFKIPTSIPAVSGSPQALGAFLTAEDLFAYLRRTQPPQRPGVLSDNEYWALTAHLLQENGRLEAGVELGPHLSNGSEPGWVAVAAAVGGTILALLVIPWARKRQRSRLLGRPTREA
jgi:hypothetical protein